MQDFWAGFEKRAVEMMGPPAMAPPKPPAPSPETFTTATQPTQITGVN